MKQLMFHGGMAYIMLRSMPIDRFGKDEPNMENVKTFRDWVNADHVLRTQTHFIFCETIQDAELVEDTVE